MEQSFDWLKSSVLGIIILGAIGSILAMCLLKVYKFVLNKFIIKFMLLTGIKWVYAILKPFLTEIIVLKEAISKKTITDRDAIIYYLDKRIDLGLSDAYFSML